MNDTTVLCGSHIPVLTKLMPYVDKPVVELGIGWNSTPLLYWMCRDRGVHLFSFETDEKWADKFEVFADTLYSSLYTTAEEWNLDVINRFIPDVPLSIVFVDHRPARKRRSSAMFFKDKADFIVLHDSELADNPAYKYTPIYGNFKYTYEYKSVGKPYTMILSNKINLERIFQ